MAKKKAPAKAERKAGDGESIGKRIKEKLVEAAHEAISHRDVLSPENYRRTARDMVEAYERKNMFVDAMLWWQVLGLYERALNDAASALEEVMGSDPEMLSHATTMANAEEVLAKLKNGRPALSKDEDA